MHRAGPHGRVPGSHTYQGSKMGFYPPRGVQNGKFNLPEVSKWGNNLPMGANGQYTPRANGPVYPGKWLVYLRAKKMTNFTSLAEKMTNFTSRVTTWQNLPPKGVQIGDLPHRGPERCITYPRVRKCIIYIPEVSNG